MSPATIAKLREATRIHCGRIQKLFTVDEIIDQINEGEYSAELLLRHLLANLHAQNLAEAETLRLLAIDLYNTRVDKAASKQALKDSYRTLGICDEVDPEEPSGPRCYQNCEHKDESTWCRPCQERQKLWNEHRRRTFRASWSLKKLMRIGQKLNEKKS